MRTEEGRRKMKAINYELPSGQIISNTTINDVIDGINRALVERLPEEYQTIESIKFLINKYEESLEIKMLKLK